MNYFTFLPISSDLVLIVRNDLVGLERKYSRLVLLFRIPGSRHVVITGADRQAIHKLPGSHRSSHRSETFFSVPDPGSGAFLTPGSGMGKKSGS
jgi:hypothetical protein